MIMNPNDNVTFWWLDRHNRRQFLKTKARFFKAYAIELLEDEQLDKVRSIYYTVGNLITHKLDYYNTEL